MQCPGVPDQTFTGEQPEVTAGGSGAMIDIGLTTTDIRCNLTLTMIDRSLRSSTVSTSITVK